MICLVSARCTFWRTAYLGHSTFVCWVDFNSLSRREPLAYSPLPPTPKQHSGPLESTLGFGWVFAFGTRIWLPSKDNICQSSLVSNLYCLLHSAASTIFFFFFFFFFLKLRFQIQRSDSSEKPFYVVNHWKCSKGTVSVFNQHAQLRREGEKNMY